MVCRMDGRNNCVVAEALESVAQVLQGHQNQASDKVYGLGKFQRNNPPTFKGRYDPKDSKVWLRDIENIFRVTTYIEEHKVLCGTHMLFGEAKDWWDNARQRLEVFGAEITWVVFRVKFLEK